jgi:hypothetical protein
MHVASRAPGPHENARAIPWEDVPQLTVADGTGRRVLGGEQATILELRLAAGARLPAHERPHEQFSHVVTGASALGSAIRRTRVIALERLVDDGIRALAEGRARGR